MTFWDFIVVCLMVLVGGGLWFADSTRDVKNWAIKFALVAALLFGPYFFWDDIGSYWLSSESGPVNIETGWW